MFYCLISRKWHQCAELFDVLPVFERELTFDYETLLFCPAVSVQIISHKIGTALEIVNLAEVGRHRWINLLLHKHGYFQNQFSVSMKQRYNVF